MPTKLPSPLSTYQRSLDLPSPADVCGTRSVKKVQLHYDKDLEDLDERHWDDEPTRPLRPAAIAEGTR